MTRLEVPVFLSRIDDLILDLRDRAHEAPLHVAAATYQHIATLDELKREIARLYGVTP